MIHYPGFARQSEEENSHNSFECGVCDCWAYLGAVVIYRFGERTLMSGTRPLRHLKSHQQVAWMLINYCSNLLSIQAPETSSTIRLEFDCFSELLTIQAPEK